MNRVFVLGAGASAFAGYPLGPSLWRFLRDNENLELGDKERRDSVVETLKPVLRTYSPDGSDCVDLERLFTLLDLAERGTSPLQLRIPEWPRMKRQIMGMIASTFLWHQYQFQAEVIEQRVAFGLDLDHMSARLTAEKWVETLQPGDTIITFNWEILHESLLWGKGKWHYADGYGFPVRDAPRDRPSPITVLKLHGSVNWAQTSEDDFAPEIEHKRDFFRGASDDDQTYRPPREANDGRYLIVPSYLKDLSANRLLLRIWEKARHALSEAACVVVIGFSLNQADAPARHLIGSALEHNPGLRGVLVVAPEQYEWSRFCYRFTERYHPVYTTFEDWVRNRTY
jgi:hypothetical protein